LRILWLLPRKYDGHSGEPTLCSLFVREITDGVPTLIRAHLAIPAPSDYSATETEADHHRGIFDVFQLFVDEREGRWRVPKIANPQGRTKEEICPLLKVIIGVGTVPWHRVHGSRRPPRFARGLLTHEGRNLFLSPFRLVNLAFPRPDAPVLQNVVEGAAVARTGAAALM
jgi:hypothetical protein